jgi:hypothetical protein
MTRIVRAAKVLLAALLATLAVWLVLIQAAAAAPAPPKPAATFGFDVNLHTALHVHATTERGQPTTCDRDTIHVTAGNGSRVASTRSAVSRSYGYTDDNSLARFAHHDGIGAMTWEQVPRCRGGSSALARPGVAADSGMAGVRAAGTAGERAAGIVKNTDRIPSLSGTASYRIPDELNSSVLGEVKNVSSLSYTNQLRDFQAYAQSTGRTFNLYVRGSTTFSGPLQDAVNAGQVNVIRNLPG